MKEQIGDLWDFYDAGLVIAITTNGFVKKNGEAVMGRGCALEAKTRYPNLPGELGLMIQRTGNIPHLLRENMYSLPVKHNWYERADPILIESSLIRLVAMTKGESVIVIPRPGCGNGNLDWKNEVKPICMTYLDDRFIIVTKDKNG